MNLYGDEPANAKISYNRITVPNNNPNFFGQSITYNFSIADGFFILLNEARLYLNITFNSGTAGSLKTARPPISWINTINTTIEYKYPNQSITENYSSQSNRGDIGYVLELLDLTKSGWEDVQNYEQLIPPVNIVNQQPFEVAIPLRYLIDPGIVKRYLPATNITSTINWLDIKSCITGTPTSANLNSIYIMFPTVEHIASIPRSLTLPEGRAIYSMALGVPVGSTSTSVTIAPPGKALYLYHFFLNTSLDATGAASTYNLIAPNASKEQPSWVSYQMVSMGGRNYPLNPQYNLTNTTDAAGEKFTQGYWPHFHELQCVSNTFTAGTDSFITFQNFETKYRIYAIDLSENENYSGSFQFTCNYGATTGGACTHVIFVMYTPS